MRRVAIALVMAMLGACQSLEVRGGPRHEISVAERGAIVRQVEGAKAAQEATLASQELAKLVEIRPRTPEWLMLRLEWRKKELDAQLPVTGRSMERQEVIDAYLIEIRAQVKELEDRSMIDTTAAALGEARFAVAEGEYLRAVERNPRASAVEQRDLLLKMRVQAAATVDGILGIENIRPRTPPFAMLKWEWQQRLFHLNVQLAVDAAERAKLADDNVKSAEESLVAALMRTDLESVPYDHYYFVAQSHYWRALLSDVSNTIPASVNQDILKQAHAALDQLDRRATVYPNSPEFQSLRLKWNWMLLEAQLSAAGSKEEREKGIGEFAARLHKLESGAVTAGDSPWAVHFYRYGLAEGECLRSLPE